MSLRADLDIVAIAHALGDQLCHFDIDLADQCESTNSLLLSRAEEGSTSGSVIVARRQSAGRGRRGRTWISAPGHSLTFSLLWRLPSGVTPIGLSLAAGLAVVRAIKHLLLSGSTAQTVNPMANAGRPLLTGLKWPNDILLEGRKLGGILVELLPGASHAAVIGCGLNLSLPEAIPVDLRSNCASLAEIELTYGINLNPNVVLADVLIELRHVLAQFAQHGFANLQYEWMANDAFRDHAVQVMSEFAPPLDGICRGVNPDGALRLEVNGEIRALISGEVSLRLAS